MSNVKGSKFSKVDEKVLNVLSQQVYEEVYLNDKILNDLKNVLDEDTTSYTNTDRPTPRYVGGWLDKPFLEGGNPTREKDLLVYNTVLSGNYSLVEIEGGVRGGKDVIALFAWSRYLMVCPDKTHMAIGSSLEHILRTVLMSEGFGLFYTIPHGTFIRESVSGAQRGVYKFLDSYGLEKTVLFYGNDKENDSDKFQGFTLGSVYVNETLNQHVRGLEQAINRIASSSQRLMIMTQNPKGSNHDFYQKFEKPKMADDKDIKMMEYVRDNYKLAFDMVETKILKDRNKERNNKKASFLKSKNKSSYQFLSKEDQLSLHQMLLDTNYKYDGIVRNIPVQKFFTSVREGDYLFNKSMKKVVNYSKGKDNPNKINNAYDFAYFHYTIDDNMKLTSMQISDFKAQRGEGTAVFDQEVKGLRRSTEGAVYTGFTRRNIFNTDIQKFDWDNKQRFIVIDPGFNHPTGITDWAVDLENGIAYCLQERLIDFNVEYTSRKSLDVIYEELLLIIRNLHDRTVDNILIDPSKPELINYIQSRGWSAYPANNQTWTTNRKDKEISDEVTTRQLRGIPLVQTAFAKNKIYIHEDCTELIKQIESYSYQKTKDGTDKLQDLGDDLVVTVKYLMNTCGIVPAMWLNENGGEKDGEENDNEVVLGNDGTEEKEWNLARQFIEAFGGQDEDEFFGGGSFYGEPDLWN